MLNSNYKRAIDVLSMAISDIDKLMDSAIKSKDKSFENSIACQLIENLICEMNGSCSELKRMALPTIEGLLQEDPTSGKYELIKGGKSVGYPFSSGTYIEVMDEDEEWYAGRVEHASRDGYTGYYFYNNDLGHPFLYNGMRARIRMDY